MRVYQMSFDEINRGTADAMKLACRVAHKQPELANLLMDAAELGLQEMLVHAFKGDRKTAAKVHKQVNARNKG